MHDQIDELTRRLVELSLKMNRFRREVIFTEPCFPDPNTCIDEAISEINECKQEYKLANTLDWDDPPVECTLPYFEPLIGMDHHAFMFLLPRLLLSYLRHASHDDRVGDIIPHMVFRLENRKLQKFIADHLKPEEISEIDSMLKDIRKISI